MRDGQFLLYYQAQVDSAGGLTGAEALVRWRRPRGGMVSPAEFIPLAEETGLILPLGHWVLETACAQLAAWARRPETVGMTLAVNVSARKFRDPGFVAQVRAVLARTIVTLAQSLGLAVIAEGVETAAQRAFLLESGCCAFQGYLFGRPGPVDALFGAACPLRPSEH